MHQMMRAISGERLLHAPVTKQSMHWTHTTAAAAAARGSPLALPRLLPEFRSAKQAINRQRLADAIVPILDL